MSAVDSVIINRNIPTINNPPKKSKDAIDQAGEAGIQGFKYTSKAKGLVKKTLKIVDEFGKVPGILEETMLATKSFKFIKGMLAVPKLAKSVVKVVKPGKVEDRLLSGWKIVKAIKSIVSAVETVFYFIYKLRFIPKTALAWADVAGIIFLPVKFISAGIKTYDLSKKIKNMNEFRAKIKEVKANGEASGVEVSRRVCTHLLGQIKALRSMKVISKGCPLKDRLNNILHRLKSANGQIRLNAANEGKLIRKRLKDRLSEHVGVATVGTSLKISGCVAKIIGLTCPPAAVPLIITGLVLKVLGLVNLAYSKFIPDGDIFNTEKRMFFTRVMKGLRTTNKVITASCAQFALKVENLAKSIASNFPKSAPAA